MNIAYKMSPMLAAYKSYIDLGWYLVPITSGKGPRGLGWNEKSNCINDITKLSDTVGVGIAHSFSGTCSIDIDNWSESIKMLAEKGIDLQSLVDAPDSVMISSGNPNHSKLIYKISFGLTIPSKKINFQSDGQIKTAYEFRNSTTNGKTVQCVLPSAAVHPISCKNYTWDGNGHYTNLPVIPIEILDYWQQLVEQDSIRSIATPGSIDTSWQEIQETLSHIPPDVGREEWITVGMSLHFAGTQTDTLDQAYQLWYDWSATGTKFAGRQDIDNCWRSFKADPSGVKLGTLFKIAKAYGWSRPTPDVSSLFKDTTVSPTALIDSLRPPPPTMDLELFPNVLATRARELSVAIGCDPIVPLFAGLGAVCAAVDARSRLQLMEGYLVPPVLWLMTIGAPADKKSPGSKPMFQILKDIEKEDRAPHAKALIAWEATEAMHAASKKALLDAAKAPELLLLAKDGHAPMSELPDVNPCPPAPIPLRLTVTDITSQKLVRIAAERPQGLLCHLDEMKSWVDKVSDVRSGEDRSVWTKSYEASDHVMDRVGDGKGTGSINAENLAIAIYGNIQPKVFRAATRTMSTDGLLQRFIPGILSEKYYQEPQELLDMFSSRPQWEMLIRQLFALPPRTYRLSPEAYDAFRAFQKWYHQATRDERLLMANDTYMEAFGKLEGTCGRFILVCHMMEDPYNEFVSKGVVDKMVLFVKRYVIPALRYALGEVAGMTDDSHEVWITKHIIQLAGVQEQITLRDLKISMRRRFEGMADWEKNPQILDAMEMLAKNDYVSLISETKNSTVWAINPKLAESHKQYRVEVLKAKQRQVDEIVRCANDSKRPTERRLVPGYTEDLDD